MADETKDFNIPGGSDDDFDRSSGASNDDDYDYDDDDRVREPINLDASVELADALAEATRISPKPPAKRNGTESTSARPVDESVVASVDLSDADPGPVAAAVSSPAVAALNTEIEKLRAEVRAANENYLRALADLQNFRRRGEEERQRIILNGNEKLLKEILPILDDFDLAVGAAKQAESYEQLIDGVDAILRKFRETLSKQGVEAIQALGQNFDTDLHEAVMVDDTSEEPDETVVGELRKGYTLNGRVIRPALVKVAKKA